MKPEKVVPRLFYPSKSSANKYTAALLGDDGSPVTIQALSLPICRGELQGKQAVERSYAIAFCKITPSETVANCNCGPTAAQLGNVASRRSRKSFRRFLYVPH
jgi:hypothetical protein